MRFLLRAHKLFGFYAVIVVAEKLAHVFEKAPLRSRDLFGERLRALEDHRERLHIRDRGPDLVCHRTQDRYLLRLCDLARLQLAKATLRVSAHDFVDERRDRLGIRRRFRFRLRYRLARARARSTLLFTFTISTTNTYRSVNGVGRTSRNIFQNVSETLIGVLRGGVSGVERV
jgi:hypothetical protein